MCSGFVCPPWDQLILQGDAKVDITKNVLLLTRLDSEGKPCGSSVGRALYPHPVDLYDSHRRLVDFETSFTFRISYPTMDASLDLVMALPFSLPTLIPLLILWENSSVSISLSELLPLNLIPIPFPRSGIQIISMWELISTLLHHLLFFFFDNS